MKVGARVEAMARCGAKKGEGGGEGGGKGGGGGRGGGGRLRLGFGLQQVQPALLPRGELQHHELLKRRPPLGKTAAHLRSELVHEPRRAHLQAREAALGQPPWNAPCDAPCNA